MRQIVVTGGGTGIGRASAQWFVDNGDRVHIIGRRAEVLRSTAGEIGATAVVGDLSTPSGTASVCSALPDRIDVLVNNAGGNTDFDRSPTCSDSMTGALTDSAAGWQQNWIANVLTAVLTTTAVADRLVDDGRVVSIGSIAAPQGSGSYGAAKAAMQSWTVGLARELGTRGITVNLVAPGLVEQTEFFRGRLTEGRRGRLVAATTTGRAGTPEDIASVVGFLASPPARHISAQVIHVNGGAYPGG